MKYLVRFPITFGIFLAVATCFVTSQSSKDVDLFPLQHYLPRLHSLHHVSGCLKFLLNVTQDCRNQRKYYIMTPLGVGQGFASEFSVNYVYALLNAVSLTTRLVETSTPTRQWEYNCDRQKGWKCYLASPPCPDSYQSMEELDLKFYHFAHMFHTNHLHLSRSREFEQSLPKLQEKFKSTLNLLLTATEITPAVTVSAKQKEELMKCDFKTISENEILGVFSQYLFQFNLPTVKKLSEMLTNEFSAFQELFVRPFSPSSSSAPFNDYLGLHLRTNDKKYEMPEEKWKFVTSSAAMSGFFWPVIQENGLKNIFVASDNCSLACEVKDHLMKLSLKDSTTAGAKSIGELKFMGMCFLNNLCDQLPIPVANPREKEDKQYETYRLLLEIFLLVHSTVFSGLQDSNIPRLVNILRFPYFSRTVFF
jgi:hypothetical protein